MTRHFTGILIGSLLAASPALADKPSWAGNGKGRSPHAQKERAPQAGGHFSEQQRAAVRDYYVSEFRGGRCPPGLAKKHNGCMPPGQAKKWRTGQPLPREVVYYDLPPDLVVKIGQPPAGYRFVRVASDILLIAVGTGMVIDAIEDLGSR
jgi:Ni/Co efflux regulator RcnB